MFLNITFDESVFSFGISELFGLGKFFTFEGFYWHESNSIKIK